eukprot:6214376-Pleurochrysis_carterae.AAC.4
MSAWSVSTAPAPSSGEPSFSEIVDCCAARSPCALSELVFSTLLVSSVSLAARSALWPRPLPLLSGACGAPSAGRSSPSLAVRADSPHLVFARTRGSCVAVAGECGPTPPPPPLGPSPPTGLVALATSAATLATRSTSLALGRSTSMASRTIAPMSSLAAPLRVRRSFAARRTRSKTSAKRATPLASGIEPSALHARLANSDR